MPVPPMYRGSTKKEKKEFMDLYMVYDLRVRVLNASTRSRVYLMPVGACIDHKVMNRTCQFELQKPEGDITEQNWLNYFLSARISETNDYKKLDRDAKQLSMEANLQDADSRVVRLLADYMRILNMHDLEMFPVNDPKMAVAHLTNALRPATFRKMIQIELKKSQNKAMRGSTVAFVNWIKSQLQSFLKLESFLPDDSRQKVLNDKLLERNIARTKSRSVKVPWKNDGQKTVAVVSEKLKGTILGWVADDHEVVITPDRGADESVVTPSFIAQLRQQGVWLAIQDLAEPIPIQGFAQQKSKIRQVLKLNFQFATGTGYVVLRNVVFWIAEKDLPTGLGQVLLGNEVLRRLGYDPRQLLHDTRLRMTDVEFDRVESEGEVQNETVGACIQHKEVEITEEKVLVRDKKTSWFPEIQEQDPSEVQLILKQKVEDAKMHGCSDGYNCGSRMDLALDGEGAIINLATSFDPTHPPSGILDGGHATKWATTGSFPQEVIIQFGSSSSISRIKTWTRNVKQVAIEICSGSIPTKWDQLLDKKLNENEGNVQVENEQVVAREVTYLKIRIISGWSDFASVNRVSVEGSASRR
uniref:Uncharacterized protein AlNc14C2G370 n=1 Tax=Albugo laibachii Nc14 TaxID=890382 RepID=F0VZN2_9STRA|nr:conserved hypothetical protein [Albugo laibachii Nc14]|eukprot:CCA14262.1 conserved hypothetical protein [Albugo laibachii Nc14]